MIKHEGDWLQFQNMKNCPLCARPTFSGRERNARINTLQSLANWAIDYAVRAEALAREWKMKAETGK